MSTREQFLDSEFNAVVEKVRRGAEEETGIYLSHGECAILLLKLRSSVDIFPVVEALHSLLGRTLMVWRTKPEEKEIEELRRICGK
jgi:hypothetical protein